MKRKVCNVLVVDDQPGVRFLLDLVIRDLGHMVHVAQNGLEAVDMVRRLNPDLVFMDVRMPVLGGLEALEQIKEIAPQTRVIIMSAYGSDDVEKKALREGALCCIAKPFEVESIKGLLNDFVYKFGCNDNGALNVCTG